MPGMLLIPVLIRNKRNCVHSDYGVNQCNLTKLQHIAVLFLTRQHQYIAALCMCGA